jgi:hypothetical protein
VDFSLAHNLLTPDSTVETSGHMSDVAADFPPAVKDEDAAHPIAASWRPMLHGVVRCFVAGDFGLETGVLGVEPVTAKTAEHIRSYIADYGATLVDLPPDSLQTSVAQWYGTHWDILVDLWTAEEGRSDLVLAGKIVESDSGPRFTIHMVYVP